MGEAKGELQSFEEFYRKNKKFFKLLGPRASQSILESVWMAARTNNGQGQKVEEGLRAQLRELKAVVAPMKAAYEQSLKEQQSLKEACEQALKDQQSLRDTIEGHERDLAKHKEFQEGLQESLAQRNQEVQALEEKLRQQKSYSKKYRQLNERLSAHVADHQGQEFLRPPS